MPVTKGIQKQTSFEKQAGLGVPAIGAGGQILRRRTSVWALEKDTYASDEIVSHQQSTGSRHGTRRTTGRVSCLLSPLTLQPFWAAILRKLFAVPATTGAIVTVAATVGPVTFTRSAGSYLTDGFKVGDVIRWTGWATTGTANNSRNFFITSLTATVMIGIFLDGTAGGAKIAGDSVTGVVQGKKTLAPLTAHTDDIFTFEEWYPDITQSELYTDCKLNQIAVGLPATGNATADLDFMGLGVTYATAQAQTPNAAETSTGVLTAAQGLLRVNDLTVANVTGLQFTIAGNVTPDGPVVGSNNSPDLSIGKITVAGQFTAYYQDRSLMDLYNAESVMSLASVLTADNTATSDFLAFTMGRIKLNSGTPDDGEKGIVRTHTFSAELNTAGGAALAWDKTIMTVQDSAAV